MILCSQILLWFLLIHGHKTAILKQSEDLINIPLSEILHHLITSLLCFQICCGCCCYFCMDCVIWHILCFLYFFCLFSPPSSLSSPYALLPPPHFSNFWFFCYSLWKKKKKLLKKTNTHRENSPNLVTAMSSVLTRRFLWPKLIWHLIFYHTEMLSEFLSSL